VNLWITYTWDKIVFPAVLIYSTNMNVTRINQREKHFSHLFFQDAAISDLLQYSIPVLVSSIAFCLHFL